MTEEINEIIHTNNTELTDTTDDIIAAAQRRIEKIDQIKTLALKSTNNYDWVDQDGKPYLLASGSEKIARLFGISWKILKREKIMTEDEKEKFYIYEYTGEFSMKNDKLEAIGTCSQRDKFFAKVKGNLKPLSEIDETNIMKAAYSNMVSNGITRLLGIRNLTWDQLKQSGIDDKNITKISYAKGGEGGGLISQAQAKRFYAIAKGSGKTDEQIKTFLKEKYNIESTKDIKTSQYEQICNEIEK